MQRVLSFQMGMSPGRGFGESSEFITKRMCFSFIFFIGFLALLGGFLLGRITTERNAKLREKQRCQGLTHDVEVTGTNAQQLQHQYNLLLEELRSTSFEQYQFTKKSENGTNEDADHKIVKTILSNSSLFHKVVEQRSSIVATLHGSNESDRWVVLSISGDGTSLALELVRILGKLRADQKWEPDRTIVFCFFDEPRDSCRDIIPKYLKSRIVAYLAVHGNAIHNKGCFVAAGSEIVRSVVFGIVQGSVSAPNSGDDRVFEVCEIGDEYQSQIFVPRLAADIPNALLSFKASNSGSAGFGDDKEMLPYRRILTKIIALSVWKFSDSAILHWDPKHFGRGVKTALKMINSSRLSEVKAKIASTTEKLVNSSQSLIQRINSVDNPSSLASRMTNDLLLDLDRALLCPDDESRSKTDFALIPGLLTESYEAMSSFLVNVLKCYDDAFEVLQQG